MTYRKKLLSLLFLNYKLNQLYEIHLASFILVNILYTNKMFIIVD